MELSIAKSWLDRFYEVKQTYVERDGPTTTFVSCGAVLLAMIVVGSRSVQTLTNLTGLPAAFVEATLLVADRGAHSLSFSYAELILAVNDHPGDFDPIEHELTCLMSDIWEQMDKQWPDALNILRSGYLYGGKQQTWTYEEDEYPPSYATARVH
jgi:hypothetical protein